MDALRRQPWGLAGLAAVLAAGVIVSCRNREKRKRRVGTRKSPLARVQTESVVRLLKEREPAVSWEIAEPKETKGDKILDRPLVAIGDKGLFTKELEEDMAAGDVDLAVHSCKDLQTTLPTGFCIGAFIKRDAVEDVLVVRQGLPYKSLDDLPPGAVVGTSSLRRKAMLTYHHPHLKFKDIRGNIGTRLKKLDDVSNGYHATILALAGLERMNDPTYSSRITQVLDKKKYMYAVAQGALAVECCSADTHLLRRLQSVNDTSTEQCCRAERAFLRRLEGGCHVPIAVCTNIEQGTLRLDGIVLGMKGENVRGTRSGPADRPDEIGAGLAEELLGKGAQAILDSLS